MKDARIGRVLVASGTDYPSARQLRSFGPVHNVGEMLVAPGCGRPPLTERDLGAFARLVHDQDRSGSKIAYCLDGYFYELPAGFAPANVLSGATRALYVEGQGLSCAVPDGYRRHGFATAEMGVPPRTYPLFTR